MEEEGDGERPENAPAQDFKWLSSLSRSDLDLLFSLKELAIIRAKNAGCEEIAGKFDLRMLRGLGKVLLEYLKEHIKNVLVSPSSAEGIKLSSDSYLAPPNRESNFCPVTEDIKASNLIRPSRKRMWEGPLETVIHSSKKQKIADLNMTSWTKSS